VSKRAMRVVLVAVLAAAMFVAGGLGLFKAVGTGDGNPASGSAQAASDQAARAAAAAAQPLLPGAPLAQQIQSLQLRLKAFPKDWRSWADLGLAYVQQARVTADPSFYPKADGALRRSLALWPAGNLDAITGMAALTAARHDFAGALSWGRTGEAIGAENANIHAITGDALVELGRYPEAFAEFQKAVDLKPDLATYSRGSYALELQGNVENAQRAMELALSAAASPADQAWTNNQLGELAFNRGDLGTARRFYELATRSDPTFVPPYAGLAKVEAAGGKLDDAIRDYSSVVERYPLPEYVIALHDLYQVDGQTSLADREYGLLRVEEQLFRSNGVNMDLEIAQYDADHGVDLAAGLAAAQAEWARRQAINVADALAWELYANGRAAEALPYANRALALGTSNALFFFHRGMIEKALGRTPAARTDLRTALSINPAFSTLWSKTAADTQAALGAES
jgi:tetratricopeptide (TPR) repeat protein